MNLVNVWRTARQVEPIVVTVLTDGEDSVVAIKEFAYAAANETPGRCFGAHVKVIGNVATVTIHRD